jgi:hypothetical protein
MANIFIHFEPIGAIDEEINIDPDLPSYIVRGEQKRNAANAAMNGGVFTKSITLL